MSDTPRTSQLKDLRLKRLAYFDSQAISDSVVHTGNSFSSQNQIDDATREDSISNSTKTIDDCASSKCDPNTSNGSETYRIGKQQFENKTKTENVDLPVLRRSDNFVLSKGKNFESSLKNKPKEKFVAESEPRNHLKVKQESIQLENSLKNECNEANKSVSASETQVNKKSIYRNLQKCESGNGLELSETFEIPASSRPDFNFKSVLGQPCCNLDDDSDFYLQNRSMAADHLESSIDNSEIASSLNLNSANLEMVLGRDRMRRLLKNISEIDSEPSTSTAVSQSIVGKDSKVGRISEDDSLFNLWNNTKNPVDIKESQSSSLNCFPVFNTKEISDDVSQELELKTHRPDIEPSLKPSQENRESLKYNCDSESSTGKKKTPTVRCSFSSEEIYAEAMRIKMATTSGNGLSKSREEEVNNNRRQEKEVRASETEPRYLNPAIIRYFQSLDGVSQESFEPVHILDPVDEQLEGMNNKSERIEDEKYGSSISKSRSGRTLSVDNRIKESNDSGTFLADNGNDVSLSSRRKNSLTRGAVENSRTKNLALKSDPSFDSKLTSSKSMPITSLDKPNTSFRRVDAQIKNENGPVLKSNSSFEGKSNLLGNSRLSKSVNTTNVSFNNANELVEGVNVSIYDANNTGNGGSALFDYSPIKSNVPFSKKSQAFDGVIESFDDRNAWIETASAAQWHGTNTESDKPECLRKSNKFEDFSFAPRSGSSNEKCDRLRKSETAFEKDANTVDARSVNENMTKSCDNEERHKREIQKIPLKIVEDGSFTHLTKTKTRLNIPQPPESLIQDEKKLKSAGSPTSGNSYKDIEKETKCEPYNNLFIQQKIKNAMDVSFWESEDYEYTALTKSPLESMDAELKEELSINLFESIDNFKSRKLNQSQGFGGEGNNVFDSLNYNYKTDEEPAVQYLSNELQSELFLDLTDSCDLEEAEKNKNRLAQNNKIKFDKSNIVSQHEQRLNSDDLGETVDQKIEAKLVRVKIADENPQNLMRESMTTDSKNAKPDVDKHCQSMQSMNSNELRKSTTLKSKTRPHSAVPKIIGSTSENPVMSLKTKTAWLDRVGCSADSRKSGVLVSRSMRGVNNNHKENDTTNGSEVKSVERKMRASSAGLPKNSKLSPTDTDVTNPGKPIVVQSLIISSGNRGRDKKSKLFSSIDYKKYTAFTKSYTKSLSKLSRSQCTTVQMAELIELSPRIHSGELSMMLCFPDEILLRIFTFLPQSDLARCASVCQHFYRVAMDNTLWRDIVLHRKTLTDESLAMIGRCSPVSISLINCTGSGVTGDGLRNLFWQCSKSLKRLNVSHCSKGYLTGYNILLHAAGRCHRITDLDLSGTDINNVGLIEFSEYCDRLESLNLSGCQNLTDEAILSVTGKHGIFLTSLELFSLFALTHNTLDAIGDRCRNLTTLNLGQCWKLTDGSIAQLSAGIRQIENLDLRGCKQLKDHGVQQVVKNCPKLRILSLANCPNLTNISLAEIAAHRPLLQELDLCGCSKVSNVGVKSLVSGCSRLTSLDLSSTSINHRSVSAIASYCNQDLVTLKINFCKQINIECLTKLAKHCKKLTRIGLYGVISIRTVDEITKFNPRIMVEM